MSGDVQPRKRKDKKRRKDEGSEQIPTQFHTPISTSSSNDDVNIHVHKEAGTGGGICAKLVFFVLLSGLVVVLGMIITQYRGLTDVDTVDTESRFSQILEGWIDISHHHDKRDIKDSKESYELEAEDAEDNISEADDEEREASEEDEDLEENDDNEESEENEEDDEQQDEENTTELSEEDQSPEASEDNRLEDDDDSDIEPSDKENETYEDIQSDEKDEETDEDEQEVQDIDNSDEEDENDEEDDNEKADEDEVSAERSSREDEDDDADEDKPTTHSAEESNEKVAANMKSQIDSDEKFISPEGNQQESSGSVNVEQHADNSDSDRQSDDAADYKYSNITNKEDYKIKDEIDEAQKAVQNNAAYAIKLFDKILQKYPSSPRSIYGKALALDYLADEKRSNELLQQALNYYVQLLSTAYVPDALFEMAAKQCIDRMRFIGQYRNAINVHKQVANRFPNNPKYMNDLAVTYLTINRVEEARSVLKEVLSKWPDDGFALVHYGFILKTTDNKLKEAIVYLEKGLATKADGVTDGRFYFHLGDALTRLGQNHKALEVYQEGVRNKVFLSIYQRSLYNIPRLTAKPWWEIEDLPYLDLHRLLTQNWQKIKGEGLAILNEKGYFQDEAENLRDTGEWKQFELFARGQKNFNNCRKCPITCSIIEKVPEARNCKRGQTKFSVMHPGTHVWPHCGPTNCRLRAHLGLKVPSHTFIRVAEEIRSWREGEIFVFDDSFEHEVWHNGTDFRLVLIVDVWHPELSAIEKRSLSPI